MAKQHILREILESRFGGVILRGAHPEDGRACAVELCRASRGLEWGDTPVTLDYRDLNDAVAWSDDKRRTLHMLPMMEALYDWLDWPKARRRRWAQIVQIRMVRDVLSDMVRNTEGLKGRAALARACRQAETKREAVAALKEVLASDEGEVDGAGSAFSMLRATSVNVIADFAMTLGTAGGEKHLILTCEVFRKAAKESA